MNSNMFLPLLLFCSGLSLFPAPVSIRDVESTKSGVEERGQAHAQKVQQAPIEDLRKHVGRETISGRNFLAIKAAVPELERKGLKADDYYIVVFRLDTFFVLFIPEDIPVIPPPRHCPGERCLGVELHADDLRVIESTSY